MSSRPRPPRPLDDPARTQSKGADARLDLAWERLWTKTRKRRRWEAQDLLDFCGLVSRSYRKGLEEKRRRYEREERLWEKTGRRRGRFEDDAIFHSEQYSIARCKAAVFFKACRTVRAHFQRYLRLSVSLRGTRYFQPYRFVRMRGTRSAVCVAGEAYFKDELGKLRSPVAPGSRSRRPRWPAVPECRRARLILALEILASAGPSYAQEEEWRQRFGG